MLADMQAILAAAEKLHKIREDMQLAASTLQASAAPTLEPTPLLGRALDLVAALRVTIERAATRCSEVPGLLAAFTSGATGEEGEWLWRSTAVARDSLKALGEIVDEIELASTDTEAARALVQTISDTNDRNVDALRGMGYVFHEV